MAPSTPRAPSLYRSPLRRYPSEIRTRCAKERPFGSVRWVLREWYPDCDLPVSKQESAFDCECEPTSHSVLKGITSISDIADLEGAVALGLRQVGLLAVVVGSGVKTRYEWPTPAFLAREQRTYGAKVTE